MISAVKVGSTVSRIIEVKRGTREDCAFHMEVSFEDGRTVLGCTGKQDGEEVKLKYECAVGENCKAEMHLYPFRYANGRRLNEIDCAGVMCPHCRYESGKLFGCRLEVAGKKIRVSGLCWTCGGEIVVNG